MNSTSIDQAPGDHASWIEFLSADDDVIELELLVWADLDDVWLRCQEDWARRGLVWNYEFLPDVAEGCRHIFIHQEEWDAGLPGRSGIWHRIATDNPKEARRELRCKLAGEIRRWRSEVRSPIPGAQAGLRPAVGPGAEFYNFHGIPVATEVIRGWGGYGAQKVTAFDVPGGRAFPRTTILTDGVPISRDEFFALAAGVSCASSDGPKPGP